MLHVGLLLPPRFANLSFAPLAVFEAANMMLGEPYYEPHVVSANGGLVVNSFGMATQTERADDVALDTMLVGAPPDTQNAACRHPGTPATQLWEDAPNCVYLCRSVHSG